MLQEKVNQIVCVFYFHSQENPWNYRQRQELRTAANFLLILDEVNALILHKEEEKEQQNSGDDVALSSKKKKKNIAFRSACAAELIVECIEQKEFRLAKHVVRVAREWNKNPSPSSSSMANTTSPTSTTTCNIDEQLGKLMWRDLVSGGHYARIVWCIEELGAKFPLLLKGTPEIGVQEQKEQEIVMKQLKKDFSNSIQQLR
jgi:hypothetical protein